MIETSGDKQVLYIDMDGVLVDFDSALTKTDQNMLDQYGADRDRIPGFFALMDPTPGALETFTLLSKKYDTFILSTAPWDNPSAWSDKLEWVKRYLGDSAHKRLILTYRKDLLRGDFLIDDREKNGAKEFTGELLLFGSTQFPNWEAVREYLLPS